VVLPENFKDKDKFKDQDCAEMPAALHKRHPNRYESLEDAKKEVDEARQKQWK